MVEKSEWFENPLLWEKTYDFIFGPERWEEAERNIDGLIDLMAMPEQAAVLDLCCGPGRYTVPLARRGYVMTSVDRTPFLLNKLRARCKELFLEPEIVECDMREFVRRDSFEIAINMMTSFGYFENPEHDRQVLENVYASLKPGGRFLLDFVSPVWLAAHFVRRDWLEHDGRIMLEERKFNDDLSWLTNIWTVIDGAERYRFEFGLRMYFPPQVKALLYSVGFSDVRLYSTFGGESFSQNNARCIVVGTK